MAKANELTIDVKARLAIDRRTVETCLRLVETYCNANGLIITGNRADDGEIAFEFEAMAENFPQISPEAFAAINALGRRTHKEI